MKSLKSGMVTASAVGLVVALASPAAAQSFNLDSNTSVAGPTGEGAPTAVFAGAAAQPGVWNAITGIVDLSIPLDNLDGSPSNVTFTRSIAGGGNFAFDNPNATRDFAKLLNDGHDLSITQFQFITYSFSGLQNGTYEVYTYAIAPDFGPDRTIIRVGSDAGTEVLCGGTMPINNFVLGVTHVVHTVVVTSGTLEMQAAGDQATNSFGTMNGFQIKLLPGAACPADTNGDGQVNVTDLLAVIGAWGTCPAPCPPSTCVADINGDCNINVTDLLAVIGAWGPCP